MKAETRGLTCSILGAEGHEHKGEREELRSGLQPMPPPTHSRYSCFTFTLHFLTLHKVCIKGPDQGPLGMLCFNELLCVGRALIVS